MILYKTLHGMMSFLMFFFSSLFFSFSFNVLSSAYFLWSKASSKLLLLSSTFLPVVLFEKQRHGLLKKDSTLCPFSPPSLLMMLLSPVSSAAIVQKTSTSNDLKATQTVLLFIPVSNSSTRSFLVVCQTHGCMPEPQANNKISQ